MLQDESITLVYFSSSTHHCLKKLYAKTFDFISLLEADCPLPNF